MRSGAIGPRGVLGATARWRQNSALNYRRFAGWMGLLCLSLVLVACSAFRPTESWQTYRNPRFHFEFVYPSSWTASAAPSNQDGQAFTDPKNAAVQVRGWASIKGGEALAQNFQTAQGWTGNLRVEIGHETSAMTLTLNREQVEYGWQGKAPSQDFAAYYPTFAAIARQYKVPQ